MISLRVNFLGRILAISSLALPVVGQSGFTITPSQIPGIRVDGPNTPEFAKYLTDIGVGGKAAAAAALLARAVIVTNTTNRPVSKFLVRFDYLNPKDRMYSENQWQEPREAFAPGTSRLITVSKAITEGLRSHWSEEAVLNIANGSMSADILRSPLVRVSVDSVLFADGDFFGPDVAGVWKMLSEEQDFLRATRTALEVAGSNLDQIQQRLNEIHKPIVDRKKVPGEGPRVTMMRERMYGDLTSALDRSYEQFRAILQSRFGESALRRRF